MKDEYVSSHVVFRQSPIVLIAKIIVIEVLFFIAYLFSGFIIDYLSLVDKLKLFEAFSIDTFMFLLLLLTQMILTLTVTLQWVSTEYEIIPGRLIQRQGVFSISESSVSLHHLESVTVQQTIIGRIGNFGTINLYSPTNKQELALANIPNPYKYKAHLEKNAEKDEEKTLFVKRG